MFLRNRALQIKVVKQPKMDVDVDEVLGGITKSFGLSDAGMDDVVRVRDLAVETVATVAVIVAGVKVVDALCRIAVNLSLRGLVR